MTPIKVCEREQLVKSAEGALTHREISNANRKPPRGPELSLQCPQGVGEGERASTRVQAKGCAV